MRKGALTPDEVAALAKLAERGRVLAILVPDGVSDEDVKALSRYVNARLDELVGDLASEYGRLLALRDRLIQDGADPDELPMPEPPP